MSPTPSLKRTPVTPGLHSMRAFSVCVSLTYSVGRLHGRGTTRNLSNEEVSVKTDEVLPPGRLIQLLIDWPAKLDGNLRLQVAVEGTILRSTAEGTIVKLLEYEYRVHPRTSSEHG